MTTTQLEPNDWGKAFIDGALTSLRSNKGWADKAVAQLPDDKLHLALEAAHLVVRHEMRLAGVVILVD